MSVWPTVASWRSTCPKMRRSWSSLRLISSAGSLLSGRGATWGQKQDGHGGKLGVASSFVAVDAFSCTCCSIFYRVTRGRVSGTGSDRRWYIDKVTKAIYLESVLLEMQLIAWIRQWWRFRAQFQLFHLCPNRVSDASFPSAVESKTPAHSVARDSISSQCVYVVCLFL